jgi:hypothetical protein
VTSPVLSDDFPILLGPVRVETRFTATELLVRVFPDDWSVDAFEPKPTAAEVAALDAYWTALWRAGNDPAARQVAFDELATRVPAGRATWLLTTRTPANPADQPTTVAAGTTVLVVVTAQPVAAGDRTPTTTYWTAVWRAHGDRRKIRSADLALQAAVGGTRTATIRGRRPAGLDASAFDIRDDVLVAFLVLPAPPAGSLATQSWTRAARARLLPDRFTVLGYVGGQQVLSVVGAPVPDSLAVSPDPGADDQLSVDEQTAALHVPADLRWLTDFDRAVQVGMGLRIPLTDQIRGGLDRLVVVGLRRKTAPDKTATDLADLITRQVRSPAGFTLLPQGTPTNNSEQAPAGADGTVDPAATHLAATGDWLAKTDGQWLTELIGVDPATLTGVPNAEHTDQREARAANLALWPATWGSYLQTTLHPLFDAATVEQTRQFFTRYVSGRGPLPSLQIGRQPYGILPTTAFSQLAWPDAQAHRRALRQVLNAIGADWQVASAGVTRLPPPDEPDAGDPHQILLDILALHPTSAEFYQRYAHSVEEIYNRENLGGLGPTVLPALDQLQMPQPIRALLARLGHAGLPDPDLFRRLFADTQYPLLGPLVDDRPLSETAAVREYTVDHRNYLRWLADLAGSHLDPIRLEAGFDRDRPPAALLYLLLRHAVLLGWEDAARRLAAAAGSPDVPGTADPLFVHIAAGTRTESRFGKLYSPDPVITGDPDRLVVDFIPEALDGRPATAPLAEQVQALNILADLPTARLERVLVEHLDCATYRFDAWRLGLANERLAELRYGVNGAPGKLKGVHLGAYGWLEDVRPRTSALTPVQLTGDLAKLFTPPGSTPLLHDPANGGFVHAPSPGQATTAAVLRAGYLANATPDNPGTFAVDLSSARVRVALSILDGMRQGQSLGAMLGYRFERGLHDRFAQAELHSIIAALRGAFPLRAGRLSGAAPGTPAELVEARNVIDGLEIVRRVTRTNDNRYPFGAPGLPPVTPAQLDALDAEVKRLLDIHDAVADLAVAEGTHQAIAGNPERATTVLDAFAKEGFPPDPAIVRTPRTGVTLTHRFGVQLKPGLNPGSGTPRTQAEPAVNDWLDDVLPDDNGVVALVTWTDPVTGNHRSRQVSQDDVDLAPIDLLWAVRPASEAARADLDDRIIGVVVARDQPRPDTVFTIQYTKKVDSKVTFFELSPLVAALRTLLTTARPLRPTDLVPAAGTVDVDRTADDAVTLRRERPAAVRRSLDELREEVADFVHNLSHAQPAARVGAVDAFLRRYAELVVAAGSFGLVRSGWGELVAWRRGVFTDVLAAVDTTADRMSRNLAAANALIAQESALPPSASDETRFQLLQTAERLLRTAPTSPRPARPGQLRTIVKNARDAFDHRVDDLRDLAGTHRQTLSGLLDDVADLLPLTAFDSVGLDLTPLRDRVVTFAGDLLTRAQTLLADIAGRLAAADAALAEYDQALTGPDKVTAGLDALKALLGEDVLAVPEFTASEQLASDLHKARNASDDLVEHLSDHFGHDFPVDDWLHGVARVREMPRLWERVTLLADALRDRGGLLGDQDDRHELKLEPVQLPFTPNDHWLGLEFATGTQITEDRLLYTAHYTDNDPPSSQPQRCGLLMDEWTEVIPNQRDTTGIALDLDRPDSEPPQAMLLVVPPVRTGAWKVDDVVAAVNETYDLARLRAVEPQHLDTTAYAQLLPATVLSAPAQPITIGTDLALGNLRWKTK